MSGFNIVVGFLLHGLRSGDLVVFKHEKRREIQKASQMPDWHKQLLENIDDWVAGTTFAEVQSVVVLVRHWE